MALLMRLQLAGVVSHATLPSEEYWRSVLPNTSIPKAIRDLLRPEPQSLEAKVIEKPVQECEAPAIKGEDKYYGTSLESMVEFSTSKLGTYVKVIAPMVEKKTVKQK